ncbi:GAF domain-containing protein [Microlunatus capsulatus]|uniref:GAF domain-containing protein n=1 Tax=Microlunatus capsulatus TaxID=99117 RepID=A0ABS4Z2S0_9ACTN|nr:GAF domain-containing protein [Microlunatus capsulatus]MBP2415343.1 GAF domain-containing protein [Microlunatus capsulatus]
MKPPLLERTSADPAPLNDQARDGRWWRLTQAICTMGREMSVEGRLRQTVVAAAETTGARHAALVLFDRTGTGVERVVHSATDPAEITAADALLATRLGRSTTAHRTGPAPDDAADLQVGGRCLVVPIEAETGAVGAIYVLEPLEADAFGLDDRNLLVSLAETAGVGVDCATAFEESERRGDWLDASSTVSRQLLALSTDVVTIVQQILDHVARLTGARSVTLVVPSTEDPDLLHVRAAAGLGAGDLPQVVTPRRGSIAAAAWDVGAGVAEAFAGLASGHDQVATDQPVGPVLAVPFDGGGQVGALVVSRRTGEPAFSVKDVAMTEDFARQAALALELARSRSAHQELQLRRERARIGQQLQDNVLQRIFSAGLRLEALQGSAEDPVVQDRLREVTADLDATIREIRAVLTAG